MREIWLLSLLTLIQGFGIYNYTCEYDENNKRLFYDTSIMNFTSCGNNKVGSEDCSSCICEPGYAKTEKTRDLPVFECEKCPDGQAPSSDGYKCQKCPGKLNDTNYECECDFSKYEVIIEKYIDGTYRDEKLCVECDKGEKAFTGLYSYSCQSCPDYKMVREDYVCVCDDTIESLDSCFDTSKCGEIPDFTLQYHFVETETGISTHSTSSYIFDYIYPNSSCECNILSSSKACQAFANLCSLTLYDLSQKVCEIYQDSSVPVNLERLFYQGSTKTILETPVTDTKVTFDPDDDSKLNLMEFLLAEFDINGTFLGFQEMTDQLILCPHSLEDSKKYRKFGTNMIIECSFDLSTIYDKPQTTFFELYFKEQSGNYIDVPILVTNMRDADSQIINKESSSQSNWKLTRRFFIWDNISGYDNKVKYEQKNIDIIQYLQKVKLRFTLRSDKEQQIYVPYLILTYRARRKDYLTEKDNTATVSFVTEYSMDTSKFWEIAQGIFIGANIIVLMSWITRLYVWTKINPHKDSPTTWTTWMILTSIRMLISTWGFVMFWYIFGLTGYWFIFYKLQYHVYALVPPLSTFQENYYPFEVVLCLTISCCLFNAFYQVYRQADLDMLVIDWEKPNREPTSQIDQEKAYKEYVSAWRYLFIVNELNELQCKRYISLEFSLFFFVFLLDGLGWDELSLAQPSSDVGNVENNTSPRNPVLRYFLTCSLLLVIMYSQFIIKKILSNQFATPVQNFIDLCSVANVSVMVLDEFLHGYYIHGVSPNGSAETGLDELLENLNKEASGKSRARGILPEDTTGLQSYEIFIPTAIRKTYNNLGKQPLENDMILYRQEHREASKLPTVPEALPNNLKIENAQEVRLELNRRMKIYIAGLVRDAKTQLLDKSPWQRFLRMPPVDLSTLDGTPYFYRDPGIGFEGCFLMGREFSFLMMDIVLFELFDYTIGMTYVAILLTYVVSNIVIKVRAWAGEWNLARKTLVNKRFLL